MQYRTLGKTEWEISDVSLGTWQVGGKWGTPFNDQLAEKILNTAIDKGVNFIDTADVYEAGQSERAVAKVIRSRSEQVYMATKIGRRLNPHTADQYTPENLIQFIDEALLNTKLEVLDLVQLHCPPTEVYYRPEVFGALDELKQNGKIRHYGVSVETVAEGLKAVEYPGVATVQIIFNMMRQKPADEFFAKAKENNVGILARVPLASGLLTGKFNEHSTFDEGDHRNFNRNGKAFDKGETFSGVNYEIGLRIVDELKRLFGDANLTHKALKWTLMFPEVSCVIPGASSVAHVLSNILASDTPQLSQIVMDNVKELYDTYLRESIHPQW